MSPVEQYSDPGWKPAIGVIPRLFDRNPDGISTLMMMRASVVLLSTVGGGSAVMAMVMSAGSGSARITALTAQLLLGVGIIAAAMVTALVGRVIPEVEPGPMARFLLDVTQRRVVAAACVGPWGLMLSWLSADGALVIYGVGVAILLMAVAAPTADRIAGWQAEIDTFDAPYSVLGALLEH